MSRKSSIHMTIAILALSTAAVWAQGPRVSTAPQVVAGQAIGFDFVTSITFQNATQFPCQATALFHRGAGQSLGTTLRVNGEAFTNPLQVVVPPLGIARLRVTVAPGANFFQGAVTVTDSCGTMTVTAGYDVLNAVGLTAPQAGAPGQTAEVFNYIMTDLPILLNNQIGGAPIDFDPDGVDGTPNIPGLAVVGDPNAQFPNGTLLCNTVSDAQDNNITGTVCNDFDGSQQAMNLNQVFPDLEGPITDAQWRFWLNMPPGTTSGNRIMHPLVIDVNGTDQFRPAPVNSVNFDCPPNGLCLNNNRFAVTATASSGGPTVSGFAQPIDNESGFFFFPQLASENFELLINVIDGCAFNGHFWVFAAATTNVEYQVSVTDTLTDQTRDYDNILGSPSPPITDVSAFSTCP